MARRVLTDSGRIVILGSLAREDKLAGARLSSLAARLSGPCRWRRLADAELATRVRSRTWSASELSCAIEMAGERKVDDSPGSVVAGLGPEGKSPRRQPFELRD